ncbi:MAG TPA: hypothetical protein VGR26_03215 [Acidimicrobiales bacterium]|nr:hypothetical protein [Acidimicrobiales bacterium]
MDQCRGTAQFSRQLFLGEGLDAVAESFFATSWATRAQVRRAMFEFIEVLQPEAVALLVQLLDAGRVRGNEGPPAQGRSGGIIRLSGEPVNPPSTDVVVTSRGTA